MNNYLNKREPVEGILYTHSPGTVEGSPLSPRFKYCYRCRRKTVILQVLFQRAETAWGPSACDRVFPIESCHIVESKGDSEINFSFPFWRDP
jgi:hypothetical protein